MRVERVADIGDGLKFIIHFDTLEVAAIGEAITKRAVSDAASMVAQEFIHQNGSALIGRIDPNVVVNRAVAETVIRIANASQEPTGGAARPGPTR